MYIFDIFRNNYTFTIGAEPKKENSYYVKAKKLTLKVVNEVDYVKIPSPKYQICGIGALLSAGQVNSILDILHSSDALKVSV